MMALVALAALVSFPQPALSGTGLKSAPVGNQGEENVNRAMFNAQHGLEHAINVVKQRVRNAEHAAEAAVGKTLRSNELENSLASPDDENQHASDFGTLADGLLTSVVPKLTKERVQSIGQAASLPGQGAMNLNDYFDTLEKDDGHDHAGRADGVRLPNSLRHPECIDKCRRDEHCIAASYRPHAGDLHQGVTTSGDAMEPCVLLSTVEKRFEKVRASTLNLTTTLTLTLTLDSEAVTKYNASHDQP